MGLHNRVTTLRGYSFMTDPKYCLVEYNEVEQNEPGDTLSHTFNFSGWSTCEWRWWYIVATLGGQPSPSASCIFQAHYLDQEEAESLKHTDLIEKEVAGVIDHADNSITADKLEHDLNGVPIGLNADKVDGLHAADIGGPPWDAALSSYNCDTLDGWSKAVSGAPTSVTVTLDGIKCALHNFVGAWLQLRRSFAGVGRIDFDYRVRALFLVRPFTSIADVSWLLYVGGDTGANQRLGFHINDGEIYGSWRGPAGLHSTVSHWSVVAGEIVRLTLDFVPGDKVYFYINGLFMEASALDLPAGLGTRSHFIRGENRSAVSYKNLFLLHLRTLLGRWSTH